MHSLLIALYGLILGDRLNRFAYDPYVRWKWNAAVGLLYLAILILLIVGVF